MQTLATLYPFVHSVRSTKTLARSARYQIASTDFDHDAVTDAPAFYDSTDLSSQQRSSNRTYDQNIPATDIARLAGDRTLRPRL